MKLAPALAHIALTLTVLGATAPGLGAPAPSEVASPGNATIPRATGTEPVVDYHAFAGQGDLAFVSLGALYVLDGTRHRLVNLVPLADGATNPHFSPNGKWLTYFDGECANCFYLAHADGSGARRVPLGTNDKGRVVWLPHGRLLVGATIYRLGPTGQLTAAGTVPAGLVAWSPAWDEFAFEMARVKTSADGAFRGKWALQLAGSLTGKRTVWYQSPISFDPRSGRGFQGDQFAGAQVLPHHEGVLFSLDPGNSADGSGGFPLFWLANPGAKPFALGRSRQPTSVSRTGVLAVGAGGNEYAWMDKHIEICRPAPLRCSTLSVPAGQLAFDPAWAPDASTLALVEAKAGTAGDFRPSTVANWYSTHHLFLWALGSPRPVLVPGTRGAAAPTWSADGKSILYVAQDHLWLMRTGSRPVKLTGPLLVPGDWGSFYGQIDWQSDFAWS
jgi:hypothetical protein